MSVADQVKSDLADAMKAGKRDRVGALRLVLSELQKAAKDGDSDEMGVLRRERKRRQESARAFRDGGRPELAEAEEGEAQLIGAYLPAEMGDEELDTLVADAVRASGAEGPRDMGKVMKVVMVSVGGRADGRRVSEKVKAKLSE